MAKKKFTDKKRPEIVYEVVNEFWLDDDTYVIIFAETTDVDVDGNTYHLEVEFHKDENRITYTRVYDYENVRASQYVSPCFKKQIEEYILQQVGILREGSFLTTQKVSLELGLVVPKDATNGELNEFLNMVKEELAEYATTLYWDKKKIKVIKLN